MAQPEKPVVGVVGLGSMGLGMAQTLVAKGFVTLGFDLSAERKTLARASKVMPADTLEMLFEESEFLVFSLPTAQDVENVVNAHIHQLTGGRRRVVIIDTSTSEPDVSRALAQRLASLGHGFLDAPVSGGPAGAASGKLTMMIGGSDTDLALAQSVIEAMAAKALHVGPSGAGNVAKLVNNLLAAAHMVATSEGLKLALAAGISPESALRVLNAASGKSMISEVHFPTWIMNDRFDSGFSMGLMRKDVRLAQEMAERAGVDNPLTSVVAKLWAGSEHLKDSDDFTRMGAFQPNSSR
ncbi:NAD(P)-dependent oxidoreductase [Brucella anthropi]|jgi:3-hydroxyisobutyrate dehydrogenase|uniref:NAD(P)-dependent oxidoreductase n=2 Tax=Brucella TaxID=234 RepID=A0A6I0DNR1_BRUAN|nr:MULTISPECIES: NAD(P)-dependent oxidoreductase [Brucella/Ochrobactrum group]QOD66427.1 NAD(P)-dependent oxidoreductase [Ochrobactrum sp. MT180101]QTN05704.1 NAD-binding protein [Ochrobactrum sp. EEELCW01]RNL47780.1 NAD(P)-dependent oxidoreductase [Ochrobactrum sp. MH181795]KAB2703041.1 NAD(P)-dependent oxidoreductase [Brucella lupini]KAB2724406.1 NAD(P)-dependent oxidoreductase [Brucella anthropi]